MKQLKKLGWHGAQYNLGVTTQKLGVCILCMTWTFSSKYSHTVRPILLLNNWGYHTSTVQITILNCKWHEMRLLAGPSPWRIILLNHIQHPLWQIPFHQDAIWSECCWWCFPVKIRWSSDQPYRSHRYRWQHVHIQWWWWNHMLENLKAF